MNDWLKHIAQSPVAALNPHLVGIVEEKKAGHKFKAVPVTIDGIWFGSTKEGNRYLQLRYLVRLGEISALCLQMPFELNPGGTHSMIYKADFVYKDLKTGEIITEDAKGMRTAVYKKKKRLMQKVHGIAIKEV